MLDKIAIIIFSIMVLIILITIFLVMRLTISYEKEKRVKKFSLQKYDNEEKRVFDKLSDFYRLIIESLSIIFKKSALLTKYSKRYNKYLNSNPKIRKEEIDFISNKFLFGEFAIVIAIISSVFRQSNFTLFELLISFIAGFFVLDVYLLIMKKRLRQSLENDLEKAIIIMNNAFKSGRSIMQAIDLVSTEVEGQIGLEFKKMYIDLNYGIDLEEVFERFSTRVNLDEVKYISSSLVILNRTGGNVVKVFESIEKGFFDRKKIKNELNSTIALSNLMYKFLICIPIFIVFVVFIFNKEYFNSLFTTSIGRTLLILSLIIYVSYIVIVRRVAKVKEW